LFSRYCNSQVADTRRKTRLLLLSPYRLGHPFPRSSHHCIPPTFADCIPSSRFSESPSSSQRACDLRDGRTFDPGSHRRVPRYSRTSAETGSIFKSWKSAAGTTFGFAKAAGQWFRGWKCGWWQEKIGVCSTRGRDWARDYCDDSEASETSRT
jgi:hypothetical protein